MSHLIRKTVDTIKQEGMGGLSKKVRIFTAAKILGKLAEPAPEPVPEVVEEKEIEIIQDGIPMVDVLFINGCDSSVPHPARYRVTHQREQLIANNISTEEVYYVNLKLEQVKYAHTFVFFRCPHTPTIERFISLAKSLNRTVLFDIDDLVIDTKYTDTIKYIAEMTEDEKALYDDGVNRMGRTLKLCEGAITTTERLATELGKYVPEVFINRNTASERMYELSEAVNVVRDDDEVRIGYFSGSITHNDDFKLVMPAIVQMLERHENVRLYIVGELELPEELSKYESQIVVSPFLDWEMLPELIGSVDINIGPLEDTIFNEAKSENKWVEAALVKVVTVASDVGAFKRMIEHGNTGFLCKDANEWVETLEMLVNDKSLREKVALNAYNYVKKNCLTLYAGQRIAKHIRAKMRKSIMFVLPSTEISGGIMVALKHASIMQKRGYDVSILASYPSLGWMEYDGCQFPVLSLEKNPINAGYDKVIATMWSTVRFVESHPGIKERYYLVQNFEMDFYKPNDVLRMHANQTYNLGNAINYLTISKWCQNWLLEDYDQTSKYAPNGLAIDRFYTSERDYSGKIRILIEGDCAVDYKRVDESFEIANRLDRDRYEVWYMSYNETPKEWYKIDKFLHRVAYDDVPDVYRQCHILLKSSTLESFSYPPLEMMATGGLVVVVPNGGNAEYIRDEYNCLTYDSGDIDKAIECIESIVSDADLRAKLIKGGIETAKSRNWDDIENEILAMYGIVE